MKFIDKNIILIFDNINTINKSFEEVINECRFNKDFKKLIIKSQFNSNIFGKDYIHKKYFNEFINVSEVYFEIIKYMINNINFNNINTSNNILKFIKNITLRYDYPLKDTKTISSRIFYNNCIIDIAKFIIENNLNIELLNTKICQPVFIKHHWMPNYDLPKELKIINITEVKQKGFRGLYD